MTPPLTVAYIDCHTHLGSIHDAAACALELSLKHRVPVKFRFNDVEMTVDAYEYVRLIAERYMREHEKANLR